MESIKALQLNSEMFHVACVAPEDVDDAKEFTPEGDEVCVACGGALTKEPEVEEEGEGEKQSP